MKAKTKAKREQIPEALLKLAEGYYELTEDVANPRPDKRSHDWENVPVWKKGTRFCVHYGGEVQRVTLHRVNGYEHQCFYFPAVGSTPDDRRRSGSYEKGFDCLEVILPKLVKLAPSIGEFLHFNDIHGEMQLRSILAALVERGVVDRVHIKLASEYLLALSEDDDRAFDRRNGL